MTTNLEKMRTVFDEAHTQQFDFDPQVKSKKNYIHMIAQISNLITKVLSYLTFHHFK